MEILQPTLTLKHFKPFQIPFSGLKHSYHLHKQNYAKKKSQNSVVSNNQEQMQNKYLMFQVT
jgi:hypothetical protein